MDSNGKALTYVLKRINFNGKRVAIALQNTNGPCPLLAVANILALRGHYTIHDDKPVVTADELLAAVSDYLFDANSASSDTLRRNYEKNVSDVIQMLPNTLIGIDVNLKFDKITSFEFNSDIMLFDFCNMRLVHGWLVDPQDELYRFILPLSYNQLVERELAKMVSFSTLPSSTNPSSSSYSGARSPTRPRLYVGSPSVSKFSLSNIASSSTNPYIPPNSNSNNNNSNSNTTTTTTTTTRTSTTNEESNNNNSNIVNDGSQDNRPQPDQAPSSTDRQADFTDEKHTQALLAEQFLNETATQLTYHGLTELHSGLADEELCVFFRNNHFNTLYKHNGELYILVTDQGYAQEAIVWEKLNQIDGDSTFLRGDFTPFQATSAISGLNEEFAAPSITEDSDLALAMQLQDEENKRQPPPPTQQQLNQSGGKEHKHKHKHKKDCIVQ